MARRFFVKTSDIEDTRATLSGAEHIHLSRVLRLSQGENILLSSDSGEELECRILTIDKNKTVAEILKRKKIGDNCPPITLFQAILKGEHMDFVVQKCTELNIKELVPFTSQFVTVKPGQNKLERFERIVIEACKQSGRAGIMQIAEVQTLEQVLEKLRAFPQIVLAFENSTQDAKEVLQALDRTLPTALIVGSEGGFSQEEVDSFIKIGAQPISLGSNILRGETAALALCSAIIYEFGEWKR